MRCCVGIPFRWCEVVKTKPKKRKKRGKKIPTQKAAVEFDISEKKGEKKSLIFFWFIAIKKKKKDVSGGASVPGCARAGTAGNSRNWEISGWRKSVLLPVWTGNGCWIPSSFSSLAVFGACAFSGGIGGGGGVG